MEVIEQATFIGGPAVKNFQTELEEYLRVKHVIPCANGTDALQIAMMALGLKPGDEVITSSFTFVATAEVIALLHLVPVVVDVDPQTFNIDPEAIKRAITPKTKAVVPVHLFGQCADMETILQIAQENNLFVIEDACQAIGSEYTFSDGRKAMAGTMGHVAATSFFPSKNLGCFGDGGAIYTDNDELAGKLRMIANHGMAVRYYHDVVGINSRLDSIQAAVLSIKLKHLDEYNKARSAVADFYDNALVDLPFLKRPFRSTNSTHVFHQYTLITESVERFKLKEFLEAKHIPVMVYYPVPLHMQKAYLDPRYKQGDFPVTEALCNTVFSLPMHTELDEIQLHHITSRLLEFFAGRE